MITDILDYIEDYANVRAVCGLNNQELPDATLALSICRNKLNLALNGIQGVYAPSEEDENLQDIFDRLDASDEMYISIQQFSIYIVADTILDSVGLRAYKTITDGKSNITRFSAESTYQDTRTAIKENISQLMTSIRDLLGEVEVEREYLTVVSPSVDLVLGEE